MVEEAAFEEWMASGSPPKRVAEFALNLVKIQQDTLAYAQFLYQNREEQGFELEEAKYRWLQQNVPAEEFARIYRRLITEGNDTRLRLSQVGAKQSREDKATHAFAKVRLKPLARGSAVAGEEAPIEDWQECNRTRVGGLTFLLDAIDGTGPFEHLLAMYSSNLLVYQRDRQGRQRLRVETVVASGGALIGIEDRVLFSWSPNEAPVLLTELGEHELGTVAVVAAKPAARRRAEAVLLSGSSWGLPPAEEDPDPGLTVYTVGGAPTVCGMATGRLGAIVFSCPQTVHDAAGLSALISLGAVCIGEEGQELDPSWVVGLFDDPVAPMQEGYLRIPRMVVTHNDDESRRLAVLIAKRMFG